MPAVWEAVLAALVSARKEIAIAVLDLPGPVSVELPFDLWQSMAHWVLRSVPIGSGRPVLLRLDLDGGTIELDGIAIRRGAR